MLVSAEFAFAKREEEAEFVGASKMAFIVMRNAIECDGLKREKTCAARSEAGKQGGKPPKAKEANAFFDNQTKAKS